MCIISRCADPSSSCTAPSQMHVFLLLFFLYYDYYLLYIHTYPHVYIHASSHTYFIQIQIDDSICHCVSLYGIRVDHQELYDLPGALGRAEHLFFIALSNCVAAVVLPCSSPFRGSTCEIAHSHVGRATDRVIVLTPFQETLLFRLYRCSSPVMCRWLCLPEDRLVLWLLRPFLAFLCHVPVASCKSCIQDGLLMAVYATVICSVLYDQM